MKINTKVNTIPSLTWNWLKMNYAFLELEKDFNTSTLTNCDDKNFSILCLKNSTLSDGVTFEKKSNINDLEKLDSGLDKEVNSLLQENKITPSSLIIQENKIVDSPIIFNFTANDNDALMNDINIIAKKNSSVTVIFNFSSTKTAQGLNVISTKLFAEENAKIHFITVQLLGDNFIHLNDVSSIAKENANIELTQIELGSKKSYIGVNSLLKEYNSSFKSDTAYFARNDQLIDFNYLTTHKGKKTNCQMMIYGSLKDNASKTYRGTIDFKNGCAGADGNEQEEVLLLTPTVTNKSIPVILCDEEDVAGEHGSTIGKLSSDVLFYMNAHGIDKTTAEKMMCLAKVNRVCQNIPDNDIREKISNYIEEAFNE